MVDSTHLILSKTAFAARRSVGVSAVSKWIERKRIYGAALLPDGRINVDIAEQQLGVTLDTVRSEGSIARSAAIADDPAEPSMREQILGIEYEQKRRRLEADKGVYVRADQVRAERGRALVQIVAALDNWIPDVAAELGLDRDQTTRMRASWRRFRECQADMLIAEAEALPELLTDAA